MLLFYDFGEYPIAENLSFFLQLFDVIWKTAANLGENFTQPCAEKYEWGGGGVGGCTLPHEI